MHNLSILWNCLKYLIEVIYQIKAPYLTSEDKPLEGLPWERMNE